MFRGREMNKYKMTKEEENEIDRVVALYKGSEYEKMINVGFVYFIRAANGLFKAGRTNDIEKRFRSIQSMSPEKLELFHYFPTWDCAIAEQEIHLMWAEYRTHGEWFDLPNDEIHFIRTARVNSL